MRRLTTLLAGAVLSAVLAAPAAGQEDIVTSGGPAIKPPQPVRADKVPFLSYGAVVLVMVAPLMVNFISSKRGHQD